MQPKFSMLLSIPTILLSSSIPLIEIAKHGSFELTINAIVAMSVAFIVAMLSINFLLKWVASHTMLPFVIYRIILGSIILFVAI
jgi:undecaprenyl-diphosphatase